MDGSFEHGADLPLHTALARARLIPYLIRDAPPESSRRDAPRWRWRDGDNYNYSVTRVPSSTTWFGGRPKKSAAVPALLYIRANRASRQ